MNFEQFIDGVTESRPQGADFSVAIRATQAVSRGFVEHRKTPLERRKAMMGVFAARLKDGQTHLEERLIKELGYTPQEAKQELTASFLALQDLNDKLVNPSLPLGPCLVVGSWSSPVLRMAQTVATALALGNSVLLLTTPGPSSIYVGLAQWVVESGFASSLISVVSTHDSETRETLISHPALRAIHASLHFYEGDFLRTGPVEANKKKKYFFGGHNLAIFLHDAPLVSLRQWVLSALHFHVKGEERINRWFVQDKNFSAVTEEIKQIVMGLNPQELGHIPDETYRLKYVEQMGSLQKERSWVTNPNELLTDDKTLKIQAALDFNNCSPWQQSEVLGPVLTVTRFKNAQEAIKFGNTTNFASAAAVFSSSREKALETGLQLQMPRLYINELPALAGDIALNATGDCGFGNEVSDYDFFRYLQTTY